MAEVQLCSQEVFSLWQDVAVLEDVAVSESNPDAQKSKWGALSSYQQSDNKRAMGFSTMRPR